VSGTVFADAGAHRQHQGIRMDATFGSSMIYITNLDKRAHRHLLLDAGEAGITSQTSMSV